MPKENRKRGRKAQENKRKIDEIENDEPPDLSAAKRRRSSHDENPSDQHHHPFEDDVAPEDGNGAGITTQFYGLLDEQEQEYFRNADELLEANNFTDEEDRALFLENVYKEVSGKELKMACSQGCSRLLERLILLSTPGQLKALFQSFVGNFLQLYTHRFASHCCETLFLQAAPLVSSERKSQLQEPSLEPQDPNGLPYASFETLFAYSVNELEGNMGYLITDKYASHVLRILLIILSGEPLDSTLQSTLIHSKKQQSTDDIRAEKVQHLSKEKRKVPKSFDETLEDVLAKSTANLDASALRSLATSTTGNPILQLLVRIELEHFGKQHEKNEKSLFRKILPDDAEAKDSESGRFINGLLFDPVGSRLLEIIVIHSRGKTFKALYKSHIQPRIGLLAASDVAGYVVEKVLDRLGADDLQEARDLILEDIKTHAERGRTTAIKKLLERCAARSIDTKPIVHALRSTYATDSQPPKFSIIEFLRIQPTTPSTNTAHNPQASYQHHATALCTTCLSFPDSSPPHQLIADSLTSLDAETLVSLALTPPTSPLLQSALTSSSTTVLTRRKLITLLFGHIAALAMHPAGSHVVDAIQRGTKGLAFIRERCAEELGEAETQMRESPYGKKVWRNWRMDHWKKDVRAWDKVQRREWGNDGFASFPSPIEGELGNGKKKASGRGVENGTNAAAAGVDVRGKQGADIGAKAANTTTNIGKVSIPSMLNGGSTTPAATKGKTPIELARERYAKAGALKGNQAPNKGLSKTSAASHEQRA